MAAKTSRERYRAQVRAEIKRYAWEQLGTTGVSALSLNAIAKHVGMSGPALYRYFPSRDDLITDLVRDAYRSLADVVRVAAGSGGVAEVACAIREWALADPQRYLFVYGTPIPGYRAPGDTTEISNEIMAELLRVHAAALGDGRVTAFDGHVGGHREWAGGLPVSSAVLRRALTFWTRIHGVLSLELAGHFAGMGFDPAVLFAAELDVLSTEDGSR
ncbi:regulatory protein, tetR family [Amycolatopsis lurida]|uniref:TetR family transcriptional regulator n=1 Tax=Amycolatopsis lurida NRRL 2430 TaxID=1460371 RepID=A0A2P2FNU5_AMYLU|nr:TetR/AcrR family transcriptional regulator [Amycolatopsis lurida]KFU78382.1 TetR family transcriptional regulator [Amycolatopsis lurida NRRL 2430]SEE58467.1 regulatory protein, tetR family [Amycolatopsis lurida]